MASTKRLVVGLGNPGVEYEQTRHNIGFMVVDGMADRAAVQLEPDNGPSLAGCGRYRGRPICLAKPLTYMNRSGTAVRSQMRKLGLAVQEVLVVYDDLNLDLGAIRLRQKGSAGGHNGIQDIIDVLGTEAFPRLRIGIGNQFSRGRQSDYVLSPFLDEELDQVNEAIDAARDAAFHFAREGMTAAMNRYNRKK